MTKKNNSCKQFFSDMKTKPVLKHETVTVPEWGDREIYLHEPTAGAMSSTRSQIVDEDGKQDEELSTYWMLSLCMLEADGTPVFDNAKECHDALSSQSGAAVSRLIKVASALVGLDVEAALKNLNETPDGDSSSD